jgi:hypothetical protein
MPKLLSAVLALGLASSGCFVQPSIHPFLGPEEGEVLPALAGQWIETDDDDPDVLEFLPEGEVPTDTWTLRYRDDANAPAAVLTVRLGRLGDHLVWDMTLPDGDVPDLVEAHRLPLHSLARVGLEDGQLEIAFLRPDFFSDHIHAGELDVAHLDLGDDGILLTAPTDSLRATVLEHWNYAFGEAGVFVRREQQ